MKVLHLYVGYDPTELDALQVVCRSIEANAKEPTVVHTIRQEDLREQGLYRRTHHQNEQGHRIDDVDGRPFTTEFAFTRFLVPTLHLKYRINRTPWALFCDSDFMFRADPADILTLADPTKAVQVVKHDHRPVEVTKASGKPQTKYGRKNWSSLVLWNTDHPGTSRLTVHDVNEKPGSWLHQFSWLSDHEIGDLPEEWNWLEGSSDPNTEPKAVHFTRGVPTHQGMHDVPYAEEWRAYANGLRRPTHGPGQGQRVIPIFR